MKNKFSYSDIKKVLPNIMFMIKYVIKYNKSFIIYRLIFIFTETFTTYVNLNITRWILDTLDLSEVTETMVTISIIALTLIFCNIFTSFFNKIKYPQISLNLSQKIYEELLYKIKNIDQIHFEEKEFYDIYTRALREVDNRADSVITTICDFLSFVAQSIVIMTITSMINVQILIVGVLTTIVGALVSYKKNKLAYNQNYENTQNARERTYIRRVTYQPEYLADLKIYNNYIDLLISRYDDSTQRYKSIIKKYSIKIFLYDTLFLISNILFVIIIPCFIVINLLRTGSITVGEATILVNSSNILPNKLNRLFSSLNELYNHSLYIDNLRELLEYETNIEVTKGTILDEINDIAINDLSFTYDNKHDMVLRDVSFTIKKGATIAVAGYNGSGKSTLAKLLLRLYDPTDGEISINDIDLKNVDIASLRDNVSMLSQDYKVYSFTIAENILMKPLREFNESDYDIVIESLKKVGLYDKVSKYQNGVLTNVTREFNQDGIYFSGGELQRLAIARAIAVDSECVILDEPDSSLDPVNQDEIFNILFTELKDKTLIIISHKMSLVQRSDHIFFLSDHIVKEHGTHEELMNLNGEYHRFYTTQANNYTFNQD